MFKLEILPSVKAYYDRIGAEMINFRRGLVRDYNDHGYYTERATIHIDSTGEIKCNKRDFDPTDEEREAIIAEWKTANYPTSIQALNTNELMRHIPKGSTIFELIDRRTGNIVMVQERREQAMSKSYHPWTLFEDGEWRNMEPDGKLPFWKPRDRRNVNRKKRIMIHEGCKGAKYIDNLCNNPLFADDKKKHPWIDYLEKFEHWGMIGGAEAPQRADYSELRAERAEETVYVCDNDRPGFDALRIVSRCYRKKLRAIRFDQTFPPSWDLADELPEEKYNDKGQWIGGNLEDYLDNATWATRYIPNPNDPDKKILVISQDHKEEVVHCVTPQVVVFLDNPEVLLTFGEYDNKISPFSDSGSTSKHLVKDDVGKGAVIKYDPSKPPGLFASEKGGGRSVNTHVGTTLRRFKGDPAPFLEFMEKLIPNSNDRHFMFRYIATLAARPDIKMSVAVMLASEAQGVGKTTECDIIAELVGINNTSFPSEDEITDSNYNYWCSHKRLAICNEIYAGGSVKPYNKLKSIITDKNITVKKKYMANYTIDNTVHVIVCSNSMKALHMAGDDRRWFVPELNEEVPPHDYWQKLYQWLYDENGLGIIYDWAFEFLKSNKAIMAGETAPMSDRKKELINESLSPGLLVVDNFLRFVQHYQKSIGKEDYIIRDFDLITIIKDRLYEGKRNDRLERPLTVRKHAKTMGFFIHKDRAFVSSWGTLTIGPRIICSTKRLAETPIMDLAKTVKPLDITKILTHEMMISDDEGSFGSQPTDSGNKDYNDKVVQGDFTKSRKET